MVIGRTARDIREEEALDYVEGYTFMNDVSAQRVQCEDGQWSRAKSFDTFGPIGPIVVPPVTIGDPQALATMSRVNGTVIQSSTTADMIFSVAHLIAHASQGTTLEVRDIISTGTPAGVGAFRDRPIFLQDGDVVEVEIEGIGILTNNVQKG